MPRTLEDLFSAVPKPICSNKCLAKFCIICRALEDVQQSFVKIAGVFSFSKFCDLGWLSEFHDMLRIITFKRVVFVLHQDKKFLG